MRVKRRLAEQVHLKRNGKFWSVAQVFFTKLNKLRNPKHPLIKLDSQNGGSREWSLGGERESNVYCKRNGVYGCVLGVVRLGKGQTIDSELGRKCVRQLIVAE